MKNVWTDSQGTIHRPVAGLQPFVLQQPDPPFFAGVRNVHGVTQNGVAGLIPHRYFQF